MVARPGQSGDPLIWLGAGAVALMGLTWLMVEAPWSGPEEAFDPLASAAPTLAARETAAATGTTAASQGPTADPLKLARLALEAGMLVEPADYSAWALYGEATRTDPNNEAARDGLDQVATALLGRGDSAFEQGRFDDAAAVTDTILSRLPEHEGALELVARIQVALTPPERPPAPKPAPVAVAPRIDPIEVLHTAFMDALTRNAVLTPAGSSARDVVLEMLETNPEHELAIADRNLLVTEMLDRSGQAIEALDTAAARTWIDSAAPLAADAARLEQAENRLTEHLIASRSQQIIPATELTRIHYQPPEYPATARKRGIEGWVEIGFVVTPAGEPSELSVIDASQDRYFAEAALAAVREWRFEPVIFMGRAVAQRTFTRVAFILD